MADPVELKKTRATRKSSVTKAVKKLDRHIVDEDPDEIKRQLETIKQVFKDFEEAHGAYHDTLTEEKDIEDSDKYLCEMYSKYFAVVKEAKSFMSSVASQRDSNVTKPVKSETEADESSKC